MISGEYAGVRGPAKTFTPIYLWDAQLTSGKEVEFSVPENYTTLVVVQHGAVLVNDTTEGRPAELILLERAGNRFKLSAQEETRALILCGEPLNEPVVGQGPFVMNTREQIREAITDFQSGRMGRLH